MALFALQRSDKHRHGNLGRHARSPHLDPSMIRKIGAPGRRHVPRFTYANESRAERC